MYHIVKIQLTYMYRPSTESLKIVRLNHDHEGKLGHGYCLLTYFSDDNKFGLCPFKSRDHHGSMFYVKTPIHSLLKSGQFPWLCFVV